MSGLSAGEVLVLAVVVFAVLLVGALLLLASRRGRRRTALRERFGPEYDVALRRGSDRRAAEQRLETLARRRDGLDIHEVTPQEHVRLAHAFEAAQAGFVDDPARAVADADGLVGDVLRGRGYPLDDFDDRAALVATDHKDVAERYRAAHEALTAHSRQSGTGDTEQLRRAFLAYRDVFNGLNVPADREHGDGDATGNGARRADPS